MKKETLSGVAWTVFFILLIPALLYAWAYYTARSELAIPIPERDKIFMSGSINDVKAYLEQPDSRLSLGNLYSLSMSDNLETLEAVLRDYDIDPDLHAKEVGRDSPLMYAAERGRKDAVKILIEYGADINFKNQYNNTPLIVASYSDKPDTFEVIKLLVDAGADIDVVSNFGRTAIGGALISFSDDLDRLNYLAKNGGNLEQLNKAGSNYMFSCNSIDCYEYFLNLGIDINSINNNGESILQRSVYVELNLELIQKLLEIGADICHRDNSGDSILEYVERYGLGLHQNQKTKDFYKEKVKENRETEVYQFLAEEYEAICQESSS